MECIAFRYCIKFYVEHGDHVEKYVNKIFISVLLWISIGYVKKYGVERGGRPDKNKNKNKYMYESRIANRGIIKIIIKRLLPYPLRSVRA